MNKLDLHGQKHSDVSKLIDIFLSKNMFNLPVIIITGNSTQMKNIVIECLKDYNLNHKIGNGFDNNGFIEVY